MSRRLARTRAAANRKEWVALRRPDQRTVGRQNSFADQQRIEEPRFRLPPPLSRYGFDLIADNAYYQAAAKSAGPPPADTCSRRPPPEEHRGAIVVVARGQPVLLTPRDAPLAEARRCFLVATWISTN